MGLIAYFQRRKPLRRAVTRWRERHQDPFSFGVHLIGIPLTILGVVLFCALPWDEWYLGAAPFIAGYLLQWIGHWVEGNDMGEFIPIKRLLGLPYVAVAPRFAKGSLSSWSSQSTPTETGRAAPPSTSP